MPITARDLITQSLKRLGVISGIETPAADLAEDGLARLNDLIATWATESLTPWLDTSVGPVRLDTVLDLPPGYHRALRDWLAIELAPEMGRDVPATLVQTAIDAKAQIERTNFQPQVLDMPLGLTPAPWCGTPYNWIKDE